MFKSASWKHCRLRLVILNNERFELFSIARIVRFKNVSVKEYHFSILGFFYNEIYLIIKYLIMNKMNNMKWDSIMEKILEFLTMIEHRAGCFIFLEIILNNFSQDTYPNFPTIDYSCPQHCTSFINSLYCVIYSKNNW